MVSKSRESEGGKGSDSGRTGDETSEARAGIKPQAATEPRRACFSLQWSRRLLTPGRAWRAPWPLLNGLFVGVDGLHYYYPLLYPLLVLLVPLRTYHSIRIIVLVLVVFAVIVRLTIIRGSRRVLHLGLLCIPWSGPRTTVKLWNGFPLLWTVVNLTDSQVQTYY